MKNYSKIGGKREGRAAYRTPVHFRSRKNLKNVKIKSRV
mgnify:CR=1 FL=1